MRLGRGVVLVLAVAAGATVGWTLAGGGQRRARRDLFHPSALRRFAAIGWLEGEANVDLLPVLRDYVAWERRPRLRRRAAVLLRRLEGQLA